MLFLNFAMRKLLASLLSQVSHPALLIYWIHYKLICDAVQHKATLSLTQPSGPSHWMFLDCCCKVLLSKVLFVLSFISKVTITLNLSVDAFEPQEEYKSPLFILHQWALSPSFATF